MSSKRGVGKVTEKLFVPPADLQFAVEVADRE